MFKRFPAGLEPLFNSMMEQVEGLKEKEDHSICKAILRAGTLATRALRLDELIFVARLCETDFDEPQSLSEVEQLCGSFCDHP